MDTVPFLARNSRESCGEAPHRGNSAVSWFLHSMGNSMINTKSVLLSVFVAVLAGTPALTAAGTGAHREFDVVVYGATPGGIAAAIPLARRNAKWRVALVTPYSRVGGLITNGLTHPDFRTFEARTGLFRELNKKVEAHYREKHGAGSQQVKDSLQGTHAGPEVNYAMLREMLGRTNIQIFAKHRLQSATVIDGRITSIELKAGETSLKMSAAYFVDATYEGDLLAAAGVKYHVGREGRETYGESLAPATADNQLQGYNFRLTMTDRKENQAPVPKPAGYRREDYLALLPLLKNGSVKRVFGDPYKGLGGGIYKRQTPVLPEGKRDINDVSRAAVRLSLPNINNGWPEGDEAERQRIFAAHLRHNVGMLYFLQHDEAVPEKFQKDAREWGLCRDELTFNQHLPEQLYIREARRMAGRYVFTQRDVERAPGTGHARAIFQKDAVAMGDYGPNCHGTFHEGPLFGGRHQGEFYQAAAPYQIPYGVILPEKLSNLTAPVACSASHVGFCALRLEPIWMSLGQAAGVATGIALESSEKAPAMTFALEDVSPADIRQRLHAMGAATIYTSDVPEESPSFAAVQWWGCLGGFIALDRTADEEPAKYGQRGPRRIGQYHHAFPAHAVELEKPLSKAVRDAWLKLASDELKTTKGLDSCKTRGDFIRAAWHLNQKNLTDK